MSGIWPWVGLAALGTFHGLNPAMGWLFAVALGLHRNSRRTVLLALLPIAAGHAAAVLLVVLAVTAFGAVLDPDIVRRASGVLLIGWAVYHTVYGHRHRVHFGMKVGMAGLAAWSFLMALAHGAGLMLIPLLGPAGGTSDISLVTGLEAVGVHTAALLLTTGLVALLVYEWLGVAVLRWGWINLDLVWTLGLVTAGVLLLL